MNQPTPQQTPRTVLPPEEEQAWFDEPEARRISSLPPPPSEQVGEFLGDELADSWLR